MFFLTIKTNLDYQDTGSFVTEDETVRSIAEGLQVFRNWNSHIS